jgi:hypothetical protein
VIAGAVAGWLLIKQNRLEHEQRFWMGELRQHMKNFQGPTASRSLLPDEVSFHHLLSFLHKAEASGVDMDKMISDACQDMGLDDSTTSLIRDGLNNDIKMAKKLQLFDDQVNLINLEHGEPAIVGAPGFRGEKTAVAQIISPVYAPEASQSLANLILVPASVRDAWGDITDGIETFAHELATGHIMTKESLDRVMAANPRVLYPRAAPPGNN